MPKVHTVSTEIRSLRTKITDEERLAYAIQAAQIGQDIAAKEGAMAAAKKEAQGEIERLNANRLRLQDIVASAHENRDVTVHVIANYKAGDMETVREDTGELIDTRRMTSREAQMEMEFWQTLPEEEQLNQRVSRLDLDENETVSDLGTPFPDMPKPKEGDGFSE